ncbi:hypothetical protein FisN_23Hh085 [Fistulifera solaris]|uniref:RNA helicase n=1 Tax=Fistulifera solaris TaxID=1519565 RepID=A0A1Z5KN63_FISSO|nr:hypothetical protein FisN_23Hh085 [Fistulifera solaris]|eukprot:GAX27451.1 hypothetical protein FisN_23Hh085 [Fistulifera solaris]
MGWFDDDDDDETEEVKTKPADAAIDSEEDPLDAYMLSLQPEQKNDSFINDRLDLVNEEEATDHWEGLSKNDIESSKTTTLYQQSDEGRAARDSLNTKFTKARGDVFALEPSKKPPRDPKQSVSMLTNWTKNSSTGKSWRDEYHVKIRQIHTRQENPCLYDPVRLFEELREKLPENLLASILQQFTQPTPVQSQSLPYLLSGDDLLVTASTGVGKTVAFLIPALVCLAHQRPLASDETGPLVLIIAPTRELATQIHRVAKSLSPNIKSRAIIGGIGKYLLRQELKKTGGVELVVATPGRLLDVVSDKKGLSLDRVVFTILDEADKLLQMGFEAQVRQILSNVRGQICMFSATFSRRMEQVAQEWLLPSAVRIEVGRTGQSTQHVVQHCMILPDHAAKEAFVLELLPTLVQVGRTLIFVATKDGCEALARLLSKGNVSVDTLHGDKHQVDRNSALRAFTKDEIRVLVATDVASRGLDIPHVATVVQFDPAKNLDAHVHRVGRAGRLSEEEQATGTCYTLLTPKDSNIAGVICASWEREGRPVPADLKALSQNGRRIKPPTQQTKASSQAGLGWNKEDVAPPLKRSRWS